MIKHNSPHIKKKYLSSVNRCFLSNKLTTGGEIKKVERFFTKTYYRSGYACLTSSGTAALFLAIKSLSNKKNHKILIPSYACSALLNAIYLSGNKPVIEDVNLNDFKLNEKKKNSNIDIIVVLNIFGSDPNLKELKKKYPNAKIILDACHSTGKKILKNDVSFLSDIVIHSFYSTKIVTSGHGGLVWSKNNKYINYCKDFINFDERNSYKKRFNFLLSDFQASLLLQQLKDLDKIRNFRKRIFISYLESLPNDLQMFSDYNLKKDIIYRAILIFKNKILRNKFLKYMKKNNIECKIPIMKYELLHNYLKLNKNKFLNSEKITDTTISLPIHYNLTQKNVKKICSIIRNFR